MSSLHVLSASCASKIRSDLSDFLTFLFRYSLPVRHMWENGCMYQSCISWYTSYTRWVPYHQRIAGLLQFLPDWAVSCLVTLLDISIASTPGHNIHCHQPQCQYCCDTAVTSSSGSHVFSQASPWTLNLCLSLLIMYVSSHVWQYFNLHLSFAFITNVLK